jgi:hypothetical protein
MLCVSAIENNYSTPLRTSQSPHGFRCTRNIRDRQIYVKLSDRSANRRCLKPWSQSLLQGIF